MRRPDFFVVGAPKCGTTAMTRYLAAHPEVFVCPEKDVHFFGSDLDFAAKRRDTLDEYLARFADAGDARAVGESSVWYLYSRRAAAEIAAFRPDARIVVMLRHPVDAMYAHWDQLRFNGLGDEDIDDFEEALAAEEARARGERLPPGTPLPSALLYRRVVGFAEQLERYYAAFPREQVCVVLQEDMGADTAAAVRRVYRFLGVDDAFLPDLRPVNTAKAVRSEAVRRAVRAVPAPLKDLLPRPLRLRVRRAIRRLNSRHRPRPPLDPALRARLVEELRPEIERLAALLDRDLSGWLEA